MDIEATGNRARKNIKKNKQILTEKKTNKI